MTVISHIRHLVTHLFPDPTPDVELVRRFAKDRDDSAFAALVDRHGPMVLGVARRVLGDHHTAEDVFQATFLALARRAGRIGRPAALSAWLHRTASNIAVTAVRARKRRDRAEAAAVSPGRGTPLEDLSSRELLTILDEELRRLPETFRLPLILCCLEGRSQEEAAASLGWTPGSVKGRLERGRQRLKDRLARRGVTFAVGAGVPLLAVRPAVAGLLRQATLRTALDGASVSPVVSALANAATESLFGSSWKPIALIAAVGLTGIGVGFASLSGSPEPATEVATANADDKIVSTRTDSRSDLVPQGVVRQLGTSPLRIGNSAFALTPDGRAIVTVSPEGIVRKFDANTGRLLERRLLTDGTDVDPVGQCHAQLTPDGKTAAIYDRSDGGRRVTVWDVPSGTKVFRRASTEGRSIGAHALSPDGKQLAAAETTDGNTVTLQVYDLKTGRMKELGSLEFNVYDVRFTTNGKRVLVSQTSSKPGDREDTFAFFDVPAGKQLWLVPRNAEEFAVSSDGRMVLSAVGDQSGFHVIETDPDSGQPTESFKPFQGAHSNVRLLIAPDNRTVVMSTFDGIIVWDLQTGKEVRRFKPPKTEGHGYGPELGAISPDSRTLVTNLGHLQRWDLMTGKPLFAAPPDAGLGGAIDRLAFTPDGKEVFASSCSLNSARWDMATGKQISYIRQRFGHHVITTPEGIRALGSITGYSSGNEITLFDSVAGKALSTIQWAKPEEVGINGLRAYALTANGKTLLVAHGDEPGEGGKSYVTAVDIASGRRLARFTLSTNFYHSSSPFSPCGRWVVLGGKVYHIATGKELFTPSGEPGELLLCIEERWRSNHLGKGSVWFSDDGRLLAGHLRKEGQEAAATETLAVWELASGKVLTRFSKARWISQVAFAPNAHTIALLDGQGIRIEDLLTGKRLAAYSAPDVPCYHTDRGCLTRTLVFAPDGRTLATGHQDGSVLLWKVPQSARDRLKDIAEVEREKLWADLGSVSPANALTAVEGLASRPAIAVALMTAKFSPNPSSLDADIAALVGDLDNDVFATREQATRKLREFGAKAEPALRDAMAGAPSPEVKRRIEELLAAMPAPLLRLPLSGDTLRSVRAIEVLERARTPEARKLLHAWALQTGNERLAAEARAALERTAPTELPGKSSAK
jgi:RNA polymerase sigma factor (sigma-70 family)